MKLVGGLGNQLFQYAAARRLSIFHQTALKLDVTPFECCESRRYSLEPFDIQQVFATWKEITELRGTSKRRLVRIVFRLNRKLKPYSRRSVFSESHLEPFNPNILKTPRHVYLDGYWQSEKYFVDIQDIIRREFVVQYEQDRQSREVAEKIASTQSVSVHVRRGDYVSVQKTRRIHGVCSLAYYKQCVSLIAERITAPHFFVFSDDPHWVINNLHFNYPTTFVTHNDAARNYEDLRLMSMCQHNIIANSSFSWWGAWLNVNPNKMVLAPRRWFNVPSFDTRDLLPGGWIKV